MEKGLTKKDTYAMVQRLSEAFCEKNGSGICKELLAMQDMRYKGTCNDRIECAARIVESILLETAE